MSEAQSSSVDSSNFQQINKGYNSVFQPNELSLGMIVPIENYSNSLTPSMTRHVERVKLIETLGFSAIWLRDVPFNVPSFGDAGQMYDPFVYLGFLAGQTEQIALGVASIILPLRHPAHIAKAAASIDVLSNGRLILGIASGDRPEEYPVLNIPFENRAKRFRESYDYIRHMSDSSPKFNNEFGNPTGGMDMLPKPIGEKLPLIITGASQQDPNWLAQYGDGWMTYPRDIATQEKIINQWRSRIKGFGGLDKPAMQSLYIDLIGDPDAPAQPIHLGFHSGINTLSRYLKSLKEIGINHVALNLRFNQLDIETTLKRLADALLPDFS